MDFIDSSVSGSFHQGSIEQFGFSAGMQCSCNALYSRVYSILKSFLSRWDSRDLDIILLNRDMLFKAQEKLYVLSARDSPQRCPVGNAEFYGRKSKQLFLFHRIHKCFVDLANELSSSLCASTGIIFFIEGLCFGIMSSKCYMYLFNSHSRDRHRRHSKRAGLYC